MLTEIQLFVIATVASTIVWLLKLWKGKIASGWLTVGVYIVSLTLAFFFAPLVLPAFPPFVDIVAFIPALIAWIGAWLIPLSAFVGFATLIYNVLLKAVLDMSGLLFCYLVLEQPKTVGNLFDCFQAGYTVGTRRFPALLSDILPYIFDLLMY